MLFNLKVIGGSDAKLTILIFLVHSIKHLNIYFISNFFLLFSVFFILVFVVNFILNNNFKNNCSFTILFNSNLESSFFFKFYTKFFCNFSNILKLKGIKDEKYQIKSYFLVFNYRKESIQILIQFRPPLIILIIFAYFFCYLLNIAFK